MSRKKFRSKKRKIILILTALAVLLGGSGYYWYLKQKETYQAEIAPQRSVKLHNYGNWSLLSDRPWPGGTLDKQKAIEMLARRDFIGISEVYGRGITTSEEVMAQVKSINPNARVNRLYVLMAKSYEDTDWNDPSDTSRLLTPLARETIDANGWWLKDGNGDIVKQDDNVWYLDVGKSGFKEAYLEAVLTRNDGKGFDGFVFDYWWPGIQWLLTNGLPPYNTYTRPTAYPTDQVWFDNAWKPFVQYVMAGLHEHGYKIIGNSAGEYGSQNAQEKWQRDQIDGTVYEQWSLDWPDPWGTGSWLPSATIEKRIASMAADPKEVWATDAGLANTVSDFDAKRFVGLAMYYIALPQDPTLRAMRSYNREVLWDPLWDFNIGEPAEDRVQIYKDGIKKYAWSRKYTEGLVLLNYGERPESQESIIFSLDKTYEDLAGNKYAQSVSVPSHTALILKASAPTSSIITLQLQGRTNFSSIANLKIFPAWNSTPVFENTNLSLDASGTTQMNLDLSSGNYDVRLKPDHYLSAKLFNISLANFGYLNFEILKAGDLLVDNQINGGDFTYLKQKILTSDTVADINADGRVDAVDFSFIYNNWGLNGQ